MEFMNITSAKVWAICVVYALHVVDSFDPETYLLMLLCVAHNVYAETWYWNSHI
jgi:hypothetical protein